MATSDEQFSKVGKMKLNDTENAAYILATHYRKMKKMISQISTDSIVND